MVDQSSVDDELALVASSSLWIGPQDVTKCDVNSSTGVCVQLPPKTHPGLYDGMSENAIHLMTTIKTSPVSAASKGMKHPNHVSKDDDPMIDTGYQMRDDATMVCSNGDGVPGFPEFPAFWTGEEGGKRLRNKLKCQIKLAKKAKAKTKPKQRCSNNNHVNNKKQKRLKRSSVNIFIHQRQQKQLRRDYKRQKRIQIRQKMEQKRQRKKDMADINRKLSTITFS
mmetsp:Transcript_19668/g.30330  ORF Transcript_19668/g.30330 Transcript_19668/m.30330 type:complete len:224 (-) Transcript_19668:374-1045(-)